MNNKPKISVIIPLYNTEKFVEKCLRSVMDQSLKNIEILCVDDCSPDNSVRIVEQLAQADARIRLIRHETNLGLGGARNTGIRAARSDYIASVDSDDWIENDFLQALWDGAEDGRYDVVVCGYCMVSLNGERLGKPCMSKVAILDPIPVDQNPMSISDPAFWNKLWKRALFVDNDIFFPNHIYHQDSATTPRIYTKAKNVRFIGGSRYNYLIRDDSITQSVSDKHLLDRYRCVDVLKDFFIKEGRYQALHTEMADRLYSGYSYHVGNVVNNWHGGQTATDDYLRHLLLMREAYLEFDDTVRTMSLDEKVYHLLKHKPLPRPAYRRPDTVPAVAEPPVDRKRPAMPPNPRVQVLTLFSGENEFENCCASLVKQSHRNWDHKVFLGMGNQEAHKAIYTHIMESRHEFDLFIKVDADMAFARPEVLSEIIGLFRDRPALDHLIVACDDYMSGEPIIGVHTFSNRVWWTQSFEGLFNDPNPNSPGTRKTIEKPKASFFTHASNPTSLQAFHFGAHRALKLVQRDLAANEKRVAAMQTQWAALKGVWSQYKALRDRRHALALVAAHLVITGQLDGEAHDYSNAKLLESFDHYLHFTGAELVEMVANHWKDAENQDHYFAKAVGHEGLAALQNG